MGEKRRRLKEFLNKHPACCFCGGNQVAITQDHVPPKSVFDQKKWPEGYIFPACFECNNNSSKDDSIFAMVARIHPFEKESETVFSETEKLIKAYVETYPEEASSIFLSANEKRKWAKKSKFEMKPGQTYGELSIVKVPEQWDESIKTVSTKIIKALHYKHTTKIIPKNAGILVKWWTNAQYLAGNFPKDLTDLVGKNVLLRRDKVNLNNQFSYSYQTSDDGSLGIYGIYFRFSFYVAGLVSYDASILDLTDVSNELSVT